MSLTIRMTKQAQRDLIDIYRYIATDDPAAAERVWDNVQNSISPLAQHPGMGRRWESPHPGLAGLRVLPTVRHREYLVFYRVVGKELRVSRVIHGAQDLNRIVSEIEEDFS